MFVEVTGEKLVVHPSLIELKYSSPKTVIFKWEQMSNSVFVHFFNDSSAFMFVVLLLIF